MNILCPKFSSISVQTNDIMPDPLIYPDIKNRSKILNFAQGSQKFDNYTLQYKYDRVFEGRP